jgi:hypothetical protein
MSDSQLTTHNSQLTTHNYRVINGEALAAREIRGLQSPKASVANR